MIKTLIAPNPGPFTLDGTRTYILATAVIDPGPADDDHVSRILASVPELTSIFITHRHADHAPAAILLKTACSARVYAPPGVLHDDVVDHRLMDNERFDLGGVSLEVIATPGHTKEHVCFLTSDGDLFTGDTILGEGTTAIFPPDGRMSDYLDSLRRLRERAPQRIYPGHGPVRENAVMWIDSYLEHRAMREEQIIDTLGDKPQTLSALRQRIYPQLASALDQAAELQLEAHLILLQDKGRARPVDGMWALI